tara:strand:+ start:3585 stop:4157 length:573 start_codon:yes stop_codon:yes gene_type:complete
MSKEFTDYFTENDIHRYISKASEKDKEKLIEMSLYEFLHSENKMLMSAVIKFSDLHMLQYISQHSYAKDVISNAIKGNPPKKRGAPKSKSKNLRNIEIINRIYELHLDKWLPISNSTKEDGTAQKKVAEEYHLSIHSVCKTWKNRNRAQFESFEQARKANSLKIKKINNLRRRKKFVPSLLGGTLNKELE